ncbi:MAG: recombinase family protein [Clostridia bacterium]|nr:recombinase family protein [Clostridia bacterium]
MNRQIKFVSIRHQYIGVGFIKSRKSDSKIMELGETMISKAEKKNLNLLEVIVDSGSGIDVDREKIDRLMQWMEKDYVDAIVVNSIWDITRDTDDLMKFMARAEMLGVSIYDMEQNMNLAYIPWDGGCGC